MLFRIFLVILLSGLIGCSNQVNKPNISDAASSSDNSESMKSFKKKFNERQVFQGTGAWQKYSVLRLINEKGQNSLFETANNELKLTIYPNTDDVQTHFFIPGVVYMNQGVSKQYSHSVYLLEFMGLQGQLFLHILEKAFPGGPQNIQTIHTISIREDNDITLNFLAGEKVMQAPWQANVTANRNSAHQVEFTIDLVNNSQKSPHEHSLTRCIWSDEGIDLVLDDSTRLDDWTVNYMRIRRWSNAGIPESATPLIGDTSFFKTVGDIRQAVTSRPLTF